MSGLVRSAEVAELRAFCAAVDLGSLGRAARALRVSQPALSKRLRGLEALAGARLLERSPRGVTPTRAGARLYSEARKLLAQADAVEDLLAGLSSEEAPVRVAVSHTIAEFVLPGPLVEFEGRHERHLSVELLIANSPVVRELVAGGRADFGIAGRSEGDNPVDALVEIPFCNDEVVIAVPEAHAWAAREEIDLEELAATPAVVRDPGADSRRSVEAACERRGVVLAQPLAEVGNTTAAKSMALSENAPVLLSLLAVQEAEGLAVLRVRGLRFHRRFVACHLGEATLSAPARALLQHLLALQVGQREELPDRAPVIT